MSVLAKANSNLTDRSTAIKVKGKVKVTLRLAVYCQSIRLDAKPLDASRPGIFSTEPLR
jgi:hypothetical protein